MGYIIIKNWIDTFFFKKFKYSESLFLDSDNATMAAADDVNLMFMGHLDSLGAVENVIVSEVVT